MEANVKITPELHSLTVTTVVDTYDAAQVAMDAEEVSEGVRAQLSAFVFFWQQGAIEYNARFRQWVAG